ncbi:MAG: hypothetical protein HYS12_05935 [Planctomycetes bacterium]|nr:hypothetical protein [Planctomycetota bacterium]
MDCRTARHLLEFSRPCASELDDHDQDALHGHLAVCPDCDSTARAEREADQHLGQAVRDVPIPQGLRERLMRRLREEREAWYRRWLARGVRVVAAVAAVVLIAWFGLSSWRKHNLPRLDPDQLTKVALERHQYAPPDRDEAEAWFRKNGHRVATPDDFNYSFLFSFHLGEFLDKKVPCLLFVRTDDEGRQSQVAWVYILSKEQFDLKALEDKFESPSGSHFKSQVWHPQPEFAYVIVYSGDRLDDMLVSKKDRPRS